MLSRTLIFLGFLTLNVASELRSASPCPPLFANVQSSFSLVENFASEAKDTSGEIYISPDGRTTSEATYGVAVPSCINLSKTFDIKIGSIERAGTNYDCVAYYSNMLSGDGWHNLEVSTSDTGAVVAIIDDNTEQVRLADGSSIYTKFRVYRNDNTRTLIAYVATSDDTSNSLVLRSSDSAVLAQANKTYIDITANGVVARGIWEINMNMTNYIPLLPVLMTYVLGLQDNENMKCLPTPIPSPESPGLSMGATVGLSVAFGVAATGIASAAYIAYKIRRGHPLFIRLLFSGGHNVLRTLHEDG